MTLTRQGSRIRKLLYVFWFEKHAFLLFFSYRVKKSLAKIYSPILRNEFTTSLWFYT